MPPPPPRRRPTSGATGAAPRARPGARPRPRSAASDKLVCTGGPASGQEFPLAGDEVVIGRANDNPVAVPDTSVSRKHALIRKTQDGWALSDLGSGNGTLLNGEAVGDETQLSDGDEIVMGDTAFTYASGGSAGGGGEDDSAALARPGRDRVRTARAGSGTPARSRPVRTSRVAAAEDDVQKAAKRKKLLIRGGAIAVVVLALVVGWKAVSNKREAARAIQLKAQQQREGELRDLLQEAKNLVRVGKWVDAKARLVALQEADSEFEAKTVTTYLQRAEAEIPNEKAMLAATEFLKKKELGSAAAELAKVTRTIQAEQQGKLQSQLSEAITEKLGEARALMAFTSDLPRMETLKAMAEDVLAASPDDREAPELKKVADDSIFRIKNPTIAPPKPETPWLEVQQRFKNGDATGSMALAQACANKHSKCRTLERDIKAFEQKSRSLESLRENDLLALFTLDKEITGGGSSELAKPIKTRVAATFYLKASNAKTTGNWSRAIEYARTVLKADPGHPGAQSILAEAQKQARDVYLRGYQLKDTSPDEAARLFKDVINWTPPDDEFHIKAKSRLQELTR